MSRATFHDKKETVSGQQDSPAAARLNTVDTVPVLSPIAAAMPFRDSSGS